MAADWFPSREDELLPWFNNFNAKLPGYAVTLDLSAGDLSGVDDDTNVVTFAVNGVAIFKAEQKEWVDFKNLELHGPIGEPTPGAPTVPTLTPPTLVAPGIIRRTRDLVLRIKAHPNYTEVIGRPVQGPAATFGGEDLGIIGAEAGAADEIKPTGKAKALAGAEVLITFLKAGHDGVDIESQRAGETEWTHIAFDGFSPYTDTRPLLVAGQPEERRYRLRYRDNDVPVGDYSDVFVVTAGA
jgi:hypothetical protein